MGAEPCGPAVLSWLLKGKSKDAENRRLDGANLRTDSFSLNPNAQNSYPDDLVSRNSGWLNGQMTKASDNRRRVGHKQGCGIRGFIPTSVIQGNLPLYMWC